ncbi:MAG TPA: hypothetical protein VFB73_13755 [Chloroflexota bacterium]|nr:hypothetical protein [Chloroflexota bacterium]
MIEHERNNWRRGTKTTDFFKQQLAATAARAARDAERLKVITPEDMPWEDTPDGRIKHVVHEGMPVRVESLDVYIQEIPPGGRTGKLRRQAEWAFFVLEGQGYDLHWDVDAEIRADGYHWHVAETPSRWDWKAGDAVFVPVNTIVQHVNTDPERPARIICAINRVFRALGYGDVEQVEPAPHAQPG